MFLESFRFPDQGMEFDFILGVQRNCFNTMYPFGIFPKIELNTLEFEPITILCGGNGSGKTTALNVIGEKLGLLRDAPYNSTNFFDKYMKLCEMNTERNIPNHSRIITSDDVFEYMLNIRAMNSGIDDRREDMYKEYMENKYNGFQMSSLEDYHRLKKMNESRRKTQSVYVRDNLGMNIITKSNGESGYMYFTEHITENALYLLDEPENSLSYEKQIELAQFIEDSTRFYGCQFIISTHSPILLALKHAKIYDLDEVPVKTKKWTKIKNVKLLRDFFRDKDQEFRNQY